MYESESQSGLTMDLTIAHRVTDNQIVQSHQGPGRKGQVIHGPQLRILTTRAEVLAAQQSMVGSSYSSFTISDGLCHFCEYP